MQDKKVTICACSSRSFIDKEKVSQLAATLKSEGYNITIEADLCRKSMEASTDMSVVAAGTILACYPRAVRSLLNWQGIEAGQIIDIRNSDCSDILSQLEIPCSETTDIPGEETIRKELETLPIETGTDAWYPVIDKTRCTECGKCHDFCLFGVYTVTDKKVSVVQPQNCKNNCPACARMCPSKAIIFPKYEKSPINGGTAEEETFNAEEMNNMYRERLRMRLQERRTGVSLLKKNDK